MRELFPVDLGSIGHAGQAETSLMLAVSPDLVGAASSSFEPIVEERAALLIPEMGESGVLGDPSAGDAGRGEKFLSLAADALATHLDQLYPRTKGAS
jgi:creatinine amidohydrolase